MQNVDTLNIKEEPKVNYLTNGFTLRSWLLTKDHKRIAMLYLGGLAQLLVITRGGRWSPASGRLR